MFPCFLAVFISSHPQLFTHLSTFHPSLQPRVPDACNHNATFPRVRFTYTRTGTACLWTAEAARREVTRGAERNALFAVPTRTPLLHCSRADGHRVQQK
jgi:hypothetical protein